MSGPKVVRVVTREELEAICSRLISQVRAAAADLLRALKRSELLTEAIEKDIETRINALSGQLRAGEFAALQRQAPMVVAFLRNEKQRYEQIAVANAATLRRQRQGLIDAAGSVAGALRQTGKPVPPQLDSVARRARTARIEDLAALRVEVDQAFRALVQAGQANIAASSEMAARLGSGLATQSLSDWLQGQKKSDPTSDRLIRLLSELEVIEGDELVTSFAARADAIGNEPQTDRRRLLLDSLVLDVSGAIARQRQQEEVRVALLDLDAQLATLTVPDAAMIRASIASLLSGPDISGATDLVARGRSLIEAVSAHAAAASRRRAVLTGLAGLGYEVREGMETAWAEEGRIVLAKPGVTDYGVEVGGPADASRLQVKVVGAEHPFKPRTRQRDVEQEQIWCSEVDELGAALHRAGTELIVERALAVGAQPLKNTSLLGHQVGEQLSIDEVSDPKARSSHHME